MSRLLHLPWPLLQWSPSERPGKWMLTRIMTIAAKTTRRRLSPMGLPLLRGPRMGRPLRLRALESMAHLALLQKLSKTWTGDAGRVV